MAIPKKTKTKTKPVTKPKGGGKGRTMTDRDEQCKRGGHKSMRGYA